MAGKMAKIQRIVLTGFSGTGKSTVARLIADSRGWEVADTDDDIERAFGVTIPEIFATHGETAFRAQERRLLLESLAREQIVIATGGGAVVDPAVWDETALGRPGTLVVALDARSGVMLARLQDQQQREGGRVERPLLAGSNPLERMSQLKQSRQAAYDRAGITLVVDAVPAESVAAEIVSLATPLNLETPTLRLTAPSGTSNIFIGSETRHALGPLARRAWPKAQRAWVITDVSVGAHHLAATTEALAREGLTVGTKSVAPGESSKSLTTVSEMYDWLLGAGIERGDLIIALGGGVIGDLAGFVAATVLRGVGLVQVPTSLLAMVDSSVGGKTGINHRTGKNLIGAFYQPPLVIIDPDFLRTLPPRELAAGWAEVLKHGIIQPSTPEGERGDLWTFYERNADRLLRLEEPALTYAIRRNVALKAAVVEADEREAGIRAYLNFGHTLGHAIEASAYRYLHGEAIAAGMRAATRIGVAMKTCGLDVVEAVDRLITRYGLGEPLEVDQQRAIFLLGSDKKRASGHLRWVLPLAAGGVCLRDDVPLEVVQDALSEVIRVAVEAS
jgi:shikimate kinase/3-dehydroquinate synthase